MGSKMDSNETSIDESLDIAEDPQLFAEQNFLLLCGIIIYWGDGSVTDSEITQLKSIILNGEFKKIIEITFHRDPSDDELIADETILWSLERIAEMKRESNDLKIKGKKLEKSIVKNLSNELYKTIKDIVGKEFKGYGKRKLIRKQITNEMIEYLVSLAKSDGSFARREKKLIKLVKKNTKVPRFLS